MHHTYKSIPCLHYQILKCTVWLVQEKPAAEYMKWLTSSGDKANSRGEDQRNIRHSAHSCQLSESAQELQNIWLSIAQQRHKHSKTPRYSTMDLTMWDLRQCSEAAPLAPSPRSLSDPLSCLSLFLHRLIWSLLKNIFFIFTKQYLFSAQIFSALLWVYK